MTVNDLKNFVNSYCLTHSGEDEVVICIDNTAYSVSFAAVANIEREIMPAKTETATVKYVPPGLSKHTRSDIILSNCSKCKNFVKYTDKTTALGQRCIVCNCRGQEISNVLEYVDSKCCEFDPIEPVYVKRDIVVEPAKYQKSPVILLDVSTRKNLIKTHETPTS